MITFIVHASSSETSKKYLSENNGYGSLKLNIELKL
jgi:hypothetical protein